MQVPIIKSLRRRVRATEGWQQEGGPQAGGWYRRGLHAGALAEISGPTFTSLSLGSQLVPVQKVSRKVVPGAFAEANSAPSKVEDLDLVDYVSDQDADSTAQRGEQP